MPRWKNELAAIQMLEPLAKGGSRRQFQDVFPTEYFAAFIKELVRGQNEENLREASRFTVDSQLGEYARLLVASLERPVEVKRILERLVSLEVWSEEQEQFLTRAEAISMLHIRPEQLVEGTVFLEIRGYVIDITNEARQYTKGRYARLLSREGVPTNTSERQAQ